MHEKCCPHCNNCARTGNAADMNSQKINRYEVIFLAKRRFGQKYGVTEMESTDRHNVYVQECIGPTHFESQKRYELANNLALQTTHTQPTFQANNFPGISTIFS